MKFLRKRPHIHLSWTSFLLVVTILILSSCKSDAQDNLSVLNEQKPMLRKEALIIAEALPVVQAFYELSEGKFKNCIEKSVVRPCDTEWVNCIEDAWVVQFELGDMCKVEHDGRLIITIVVNSLTREIISQYPATEYLQTRDFCHDSNDCLCRAENSEGEEGCANFMHAPLLDIDSVWQECPDCCIKHSCKRR